jgi:hypothetical protein
MEKLSLFVKKRMEELGLSEWQVQKRANGKVSDSYVKNIISGKAKSISVEKLNALAVGLGIDGIELYKIASGEDIPQKQQDPWPGFTILNTIQQIMTNPDLTEIVKHLIDMKPTKIKAIKKQIKGADK